MKTTYITLLLSATFLSSCMMVGPDYEAPSPQMPETWVTTPPPATSGDLSSWWKIFKDEQLNTLIKTALTNNYDLTSAIARVIEARAAYTSAISDILPQIDSNFRTNKASTNGLKTHSAQSYSSGLDMSWELDIFGGGARKIEASLALLASTEASALAVRTALLSEVATAYFNWINYSEQLEIANEQLQLQAQTLDIAKRKQESGTTSSLDYQQALAQYTATQASIPNIRTQMIIAHNSVATLLGVYPSQLTLTAPNKNVSKAMPIIPVGLPSDLLRRRPDIIMAENDLHAATANIGVAISDFFPKFSLTGGLNTGATDFSNVYSSQSTNWSLGGMVTLPIFTSGKLTANLITRESQAAQSALSYQKALINAVKEVENSLVTYANSKEQLKFTQESCTASRKAYELALIQYQNGIGEFIDVITAQQGLLNKEESIIDLRQSIRKSVAQLANALGGGWDNKRSN